MIPGSIKLNYRMIPLKQWYLNWNLQIYYILRLEDMESAAERAEQQAPTKDAPWAFNLKLTKVMRSSQCGYSSRLDPELEIKHQGGDLKCLAAKLSE